MCCRTRSMNRFRSRRAVAPVATSRPQVHTCRMDNTGTAPGAIASGNLSDFGGGQGWLGGKRGHGGAGHVCMESSAATACGIRSTCCPPASFPHVPPWRKSRPFIGTALIIASIVHVCVSLLVGLLYGAMLPMFPRRPILLGGVIAPDSVVGSDPQRSRGGRSRDEPAHRLDLVCDFPDRIRPCRRHRRFKARARTNLAISALRRPRRNGSARSHGREETEKDDRQ